jgi:DNA-binding transcriptional ArsR family regulator
MNKKELIKILKIISNEWRALILLYLIENKEAYVGDIAEAVNTSFRNTSKSLSILAKNNLVRSRKKFVRKYYSIDTKNFPKDLLNIFKNCL